jgi:glucokinase
MLIGIDLGGTKILTAVADEKGRILASVKMDTQAKKGPEAVLSNIRSSVSSALLKAGRSMKEVSCIGLGAPGPIIGDGVIIAPPNLPGFGRYDIKKKLSSMFGKKVVVENDANAAAVAEHLFGSGKGTRNFVYVTVSTGIGGGIILDRKLFRGTLGTAGEIGHMVIDVNGPKCGCGNHGCLEAMASGPAIARSAGKKSAIEVFEMAKKGDKKCLKAVKTAGMYIGIGMANIINILNPEVIAIGGGVSNMGPMLFGPIREWGKKNTLNAARGSAKIVPAKLKNDVGVLGAIAICMRG